MVTLFRRIRERLIASGSLTKYLLYAVGEILLVVIGILIALQVNAIQIEKDNRRTEMKVLEKLHQDLQKDEMDLGRLREVKEGQKTSSAYMLTFYENPDQGITDTTSHVRNIHHPFAFYVDNPHRVAFSTSMNSGDLFMIQNERLLDLLSFYFADNNLSQFMTSVKDFSNYFNSEVKMKKYVIMRPENYSDLDMSKFWADHEMENYYYMMAGNLLPISISLITKKMEVNKNLQSLIDHELGIQALSETEWETIYQEIVDANRTY
ncbi:DUF6090 family protein [Balneola sp. MJW-20]|uniref:DUF6090 family protein n=1 Tax=Gracilimonas aurantiaca TaxID=3234185 RepID=UPI003464F217